MSSTHTQRLALYNQGKNDREIAEASGVCRTTITTWRKRYQLPAHRESRPVRIPKQHVPMEEALTPDQCQVMRKFFADLLMAAEHGRVDVGKFMTIYRDCGVIEKGA